jgi:hypothetical protein
MTENSFPIGARVTGIVRDQHFTGTVTSRALVRDALMSVHVATDQDLAMPSGRRVRGAHISTPAGLAALRIA